MNILSIQSHVAYGHVGNAAAVFPMQRLGVEVWPIHTVQFSNHTGYGHWTGRVFDGAMIGEVFEGISQRGVLASCDGVLSGYMGAPDIGEAIVTAVARVRAANQRALYCCDPVIGDVGRGVFVRPGVPEFMRERAVPLADIVTPNQFELDFLTGRTSATLSDAKAAVKAVHGLGPRIVLVTSLFTEETPAGSIDLLVSDGEGAWRLRTPKLAVSLNGAGDAIAALFLVNFAKCGAAAAALSAAGSAVYSLLKRTEEAGARELVLVAAQDEIVTPSWRFDAQKI